MVTMVNTDFILFMCVCVCVYQWDSSLLQAWCRSSGVHVVEQTINLPQRNSSSSVTDLKAGHGRDGVRDHNNLSNHVSTCLWFTLMERSSLPRVTFAFTGGNPSSLFS